MSAASALTVVGNTTLDVMVSGVTALPDPGTEQLVPDISIRLGGSAGNLALRCAGLGQRTTLISRMGDDASTPLVRAELQAPNLEAILVTDPVLPSGVTVAVEAPGRDRAFLSSLGAMSELGPEDIPAAALASGCLVLAGYFLLPKLRGPALAALFGRAQAAGSRTVLDTGWPTEGWTAAVRAEVRAVLADVDLFLPNEDELSGLTGSDDPRAAAVKLARAAGCTVVAKLGADGAGLAMPDGTWLYEPTRPVVPVDSTGAGDGFNAAFLACLARGDGPDAALRSAVRYATALVGTEPAQRGSIRLPQALPL